MGCIWGDREVRTSAFPFSHPTSRASVSPFGSLGIMPCVLPSPGGGVDEGWQCAPGTGGSEGPVNS